MSSIEIVDKLPTPPPSPYITSSPVPETISKPKEEKEKKQIQRDKIQNLEEKHCLLLNMFFCFFFPMVCRCSPLGLDDIPVVHSKDLAEIAIERAEKGFAKRYDKYLKEKVIYEKKKQLNPNLKPPSKPSLLNTLLLDVSSCELWFGVFIIVFSTVFLVIQPFFQQYLLEGVQKKETNKEEEFPYVFGILLCLCPFLNTFFDAWGNRIFIHYSIQIRSAMNGMIYNKVFQLDMSSQSNLDKGKLISLVSNDSRNACDQCAESLMIISLPSQIIVPFYFVIYHLKWVGVVVLIVLLLIAVPQFILTFAMQRALTQYMYSNDQRNRMMNETLQGIKVVKLTGLEAVFIGRVKETRVEQLSATFRYTMYMQSVQSLMKCLPLLINFVCILIAVPVFDLNKENFSIRLASSITFMTMVPISQSTLCIQAFTFTYMGIARIRDFLLLPNARKVEVKKPLSDEIALNIVGGAFKWTTVISDDDLTNDQKHEADVKLKILQGVEAKAMRRREEEAKRRREEKEEEMEEFMAENRKEKEEEEAEAEEDEEENEENTDSSANGSNSGVPTTIVLPKSSFPSSIFTPRGPNTPHSPVGSNSPFSSPLLGPNKSPVTPHSTSPLLSPLSPSATASASLDRGDPTTPDPNQPTLRNIDISLKKGSLTMVVGGVGCGKSSFASALIDEIPLVSGEIRRIGTISYCPQAAWITGNTLRNNIVFGCPFDEEHYLEVIRICALERDVRSFPAGDLTAIGERGANLSGGQRARIQLARCVYSNRDICVMDDVLSAVDAHVGKFLFEECICKFLKNKTRVLMTNQLQYLDKADNIIVLCNGEIVGQGHYEELKAVGIDFSEYILSEKGRRRTRKTHQREMRKKRREEKMKAREIAKQEKEKEKEKAANEEKERKAGLAKLQERYPMYIFEDESYSLKSKDQDHAVHGKGDEEEDIAMMEATDAVGGGGKGKGGSDVRGGGDETMMEIHHPLGSDFSNNGAANKQKHHAATKSLGSMTSVGTSSSSYSTSSVGSTGSAGTVSTRGTTGTQGTRVSRVPFTLQDMERGVNFSDEEVEAAKKIMTTEEYSQKSVAWTTYGSYLLKLMPGILLVPYFLVTLVVEGSIGVSNYWLGVIGNSKSFSEITFWNKIYMYSIFLGIEVVAVVVRTIWSAFAVRRSNRIIHDRLLTNVISAPPSFFDTTPLGRILNRFSSELSQTDQFLHMYLMTNIYFYMGLVRCIIVVGISTPQFLYIGLPAIGMFLLILYIYSGPSRNLQRMDSIARSPVISIFTETITGAGLATIKSYHLQDEWRRRFNEVNDEWSARRVLFREGQKWAVFYTSIAATVFMTGVVVIGWFFMPPSVLGVAIEASITFSVYAIFIVMQSVELDSRMTSYERIDYYSTRIPQENNRSIIVPPRNWPVEGRIVFNKVQFRYRPGLPYVLRGVSFTVNHGEKVGVCGRTGAGKSSLLFVMFRLVELDPTLMPVMIDMNTGFPVNEGADEPPNSGSIQLDGIDISQVALDRVRQSISIIPQDPTLFTGSVRYNLDLAYKCTDEEINTALDLIEMRQTIEDMAEGLDTPVAESGSNFSCGQRQLLCFGRAILNKSRIVILDEATASVDVETDAKIQNMVRNHLKNQTVFVIAHRLNTIINSDKILVLDQGSVVEFDSPANLRANPLSAFNALLKSGGGEGGES